MKKRSCFLSLAVSIALILSFALPAYSGKIQQELVSESTVEQVLKRGVLRVGMSTFVPWAMKDKNGELIGFEIDVAKKVAEDMGVKAEFIPTKWAGIIPALLTGKFDVIIGGMGIIPKRNLKVNFTIPYDYSGMSMVAHRELAKGFASLEDFNKPDVTIAVRIGSTAASAAKEFMPNAKIRMFDDEAQAYQELMNGKAHAVIGSAPTPAFHALKNPEKLFLPLSKTFTREPIGFAVRKGDSDTLNFFNSWIRFNQDNGWLKKQKHYWFETNEWEAMVQ
ncbi:amino acid ABC transporter substrate-binding pro tein [Desulfonema ishimotonii]|uniref:Amino acid ABC transporter substrate-binding pro tein n=1 Tax=Desulfonema ishimotonii TaxID=45657 RepID=A0A401FW99_9BACT|nr:transporter substrate-binding domain-containing protein [Desulfonema ishimotonii]GBC61214.1 amino acid ABC transporter substrate-binding pro tein [Desulfonema ishimotonii]